MYKKAGFTLVELLLSLAIISIIALALFSILDYTVKACKLREDDDEILLNGRYALEYIKREIKNADKIYGLNKFEGLQEEFDNNFGFVVFNHNTSIRPYNYSVFYHKDNKIYRAACNFDTDRLPKGSAFAGYNAVAEHIISIEGTCTNLDTKLINLSITLKGKGYEETNFHLKVCIRSPIIK